MVEQVKIDEIDVKILKALIKDARTSFAEIARDCGVSTSAIVKRFYRLKKEGVIAGTSLMVDIEKFGYKFLLSIGINVDKAYEISLLENLKTIPKRILFGQELGKFDIHAVAAATDLQEVDTIRNLIKAKKVLKALK